MDNIFLFFGVLFLLFFLIGILLKKIRVPWIFSALILGLILAIYNPFKVFTSSSIFGFLSNLGMYFLLFIIGFELDLNMFKKNEKFIIEATIFVISLSTLFGMILIYFLFHISWFLSFIISLSFATVGEAILVPILDEFKIVNTKLGQSIIGIGTLDDIVEVSLLILVVLLIGKNSGGGFSLVTVIFSFVVLIFLTLLFFKFRKEKRQFKFLSIEVLFLFIFFVFFLFLGIGELAHSSAIAALLAGIILNTFVPEDKLEKVKKEIKILGYGFFAPIFFLEVGISMNMHYLLLNPLIVILFFLVSGGAKLLGSWIIGKKEMTLRESIILGIGLSVRFSTSIIVIKLLLDNHLIGNDLYSVVISSTILFTFIIPILFSNLLIRWKIKKRKNKN